MSKKRPGWLDRHLAEQAAVMMGSTAREAIEKGVDLEAVYYWARMAFRYAAEYRPE